MLTRLFLSRPAFLLRLNAPAPEASCTEVALFDTGWWPTADPINIWLLWNADKGAIPGNPTKLGTYKAKVQGVSGQWIRSNTTLWAIPNLGLSSGVRMSPGGTQTVPLDGGAKRTAGALVMSGELAGTGNTSVGGAFPRAVLTYDFAATYGCVLSYQTKKLGLYPVDGGISAAFAAARRDFPHLPSVRLSASTGTSWGLMLELDFLDASGKLFQGRFLVDTGAIGITLMVTQEFGKKLGCYAPPVGESTTGVGGRVCAPLRRACVVGGADRVLLPRRRGGERDGVPGLRRPHRDSPAVFDGRICRPDGRQCCLLLPVRRLPVGPRRA